MPRKARQLHVVKHPLVAHMLAEARHRQTPPSRFRQLVAQIGALMAYEVSRDLPLEPVRIDTPLEPCQAQKLRLPVTVVPVLRAGLGMAQGVMQVIPDAQVGHIGMFRDEKRLSPVSYYDKLPLSAAAGPVLLLDPMLATGGSAMAAITLLRDHGCRDIRLVCIVVSPEGLEKLAAVHPKVPVFAAALDRELDDRGFILPGLGDAGDRLFGTSGP